MIWPKMRVLVRKGDDPISKKEQKTISIIKQRAVLGAQQEGS